MTYTILSSNGHEDGPFDLIMLIKKVRSGRLRPEDLIWEDGTARGEAIAAIMHPELADVFRELETATTQEQMQAGQFFDIKRLLRAGVWFLQENHGVTVYSGLYAAFGIIPLLFVFGALPFALAVPLGAGLAVWNIYLLAGLMWMVLRTHRGQPADIDTVRHMMSQRQKEMIRLATIIGLGTYIGSFFFIIPAFFVLTFTLPAVYYVMEFDMEPWEAVALSRRKIQEMGGDAVGVMFGLTVIGFIGFPVVFLPIVLLPIVLYAFAKLYDDVLASVN